MNTFTKIAEANLAHYNNHPAAHLAITIAYGAAASCAVVKMAKSLKKKDNPYVINDR